jgi:hypothetical protein
MMTQELQLQVPDVNHVKESFREGSCAWITWFNEFAVAALIALGIAADQLKILLR